jgi:hypothetical protein
VNHDLWIGNKVLTISLEKDSKGFPPAPEQVAALGSMVQLLARAIKAVAFHAENAPEGDGTADFVLQPVEGIGEAILLLTQLSGAVQAEMQA